MSKALQWIIGICFVVVAVAIIASLVAPLVFGGFGVAAGRGIQRFGDGRMFGFWGPGHMFMFGGRGMMGNFGMPFFGLGMLIGPLVIIGLVVLAVVLLTRRSPAPAAQAAAPVAPAAIAPAPATTPCAHCGQPLEAGWKACPYCGEKV